jgi:hypothetical protein
MQLYPQKWDLFCFLNTNIKMFLTNDILNFQTSFQQMTNII